jgi:predicted phosphodiesterase
VRVAVLADVHGNLPALRSCVDVARRAGVDAWWCAGDVVGYGPWPNECIELLGELGALCVAGNHELLTLGRLSGERSGRLCRETTLWTRARLRPDARALVAELPLVRRIGDAVLTHGSLIDPEQYLRTAFDACEQLDLLGQDFTGARLLVVGHTHRQWAFSAQAGNRDLTRSVTWTAEELMLLNPGAVGQSREREPVPRARFAVVDLERSEAAFHSVAYDLTASRAGLRANGLRSECLHIHPGPLPTLLRRSRRLARAIRRRVLPDAS